MKSKAEEAYQIIKEKIINLELKPLSDISEDKIQHELGISRTPVREAIQRLAKEEFVKIYSRKATIVSDVTLDLINSIYEIRLLNEPYLAKRSCYHIPDEKIQELTEGFLKLKDNCDGWENRRYYITLDKELHDNLTCFSNNNFLNNTFVTVNDHSQRIRILTSSRNRDYEVSIRQHLDILDALSKRNEAQLEESVREHILHAKGEAFEYYR